ncbi:MAG TPA: hypothetical protein VIF37_06280 [Methylobacter sp.]
MTTNKVTLVPKLQLGNPVSEALGNRSLRCSTSCIHAVTASQDGKLELPALNSQAPAWELAISSFPCAAWECSISALRCVEP